MRSGFPLVRFLVCVPLVWPAGCVIVNPPNVSVSGFNQSPQNGPPRTPYASALEDVLQQSGDVRTQLNDRDWEDTSDEIDDWIQYTRKLIGYADSSGDPARFRAYGNELLRAIEQLRRAVVRRDMRASEDALRACDPILDKFSRDFPLTRSPSRRESPPQRSSANRAP